MRKLLVLALAALLAFVPAGSWLLAQSGQSEKVDVALVLAVDVSNSVTPERYRLQMEGIANAFADPEVQAAILSGPHKAMFVILIEWSDRPIITVPWTLITSEEGAAVFAEKVRAAPRQWEGFTCMATALQYIYDRVVPLLPAPAERIVVDVSGDGRNNCDMLAPAYSPLDRPATDVTALVRDRLVNDGITINGLPILEGDEAETLEDWYRQNVIGGTSAFLIPAHSFADVQRAMRLKFLTELISSR